MKSRGVGYLLLSSLDDVAYLLNLRGSDIEYNPVFFSYVVVSQDKVYLFMEESVLDTGVIEHLKGVEIRSYESISGFLADLHDIGPSKKIWMSTSASQAVVSQIPNKQHLITDVTPVTLRKAVKNTTELEGFVNCHIRDGAALCCYFAWLEKELLEKGNWIIFAR